VRQVVGAQVSARLEAAQVVHSQPAVVTRHFIHPLPSSLLPQKTRPDALAFLSDFVVDAVVDQFAREIVLEITRERSREALYELKAQREWDALLSSEIGSVAVAALEECRAELVAAAKKAQPQVRPSACCPRYRIASQMLRLLREWFFTVRLHACRVQCAADDICRAHRFACSGPSGQHGGGVALGVGNDAPLWPT